MEDYIAVLRNEFEAGGDSFLIQIRTDLVWNKDVFTRLVMAMHRCCEEHANSDVLERWMASGFFYLSTFIRDWTTHPSFPQTHELEYYQNAYQRLDDLAYWFFFGESPYLAGHGFESI